MENEETPGKGGDLSNTLRQGSSVSTRQQLLEHASDTSGGSLQAGQTAALFNTWDELQEHGEEIRGKAQAFYIFFFKKS